MIMIMLKDDNLSRVEEDRVISRRRGGGGDIPGKGCSDLPHKASQLYYIIFQQGHQQSCQGGQGSHKCSSTALCLIKDIYIHTFRHIASLSNIEQGCDMEVR